MSDWIKVTHVKDVPTLKQFAETNGLEMSVNERAREFWNDKRGTRFYAWFENAEIKEDVILHTFAGNGDTPHEAVYRYMEGIRGKMLVLDAMTGYRRTLFVPFITEIE